MFSDAHLAEAEEVLDFAPICTVPWCVTSFNHLEFVRIAHARGFNFATANAAATGTTSNASSSLYVIPPLHRTETNSRRSYGLRELCGNRTYQLLVSLSYQGSDVDALRQRKVWG